MEQIASILETVMIISFGISWPLSIIRSYRSKSTKGKSLMFSCFILIGYACGIARKIIQIVSGSSGFLFYLSFFFYVLNFIEISIDVALYFRNKKLDAIADAKAAAQQLGMN